MKALSNKNFGNGKATLDNGYGMFLSMLEYKLADRGKHFVKVSKWYPLILSILVDTFISKISLPMQPVPEIRSISGA